MFVCFFDLKKIIFFSELKKKVGYSFDVKFYDLSIYEHFRAIPALLGRFWELLLTHRSEKIRKSLILEGCQQHEIHRKKYKFHEKS